MAFIIFDQGVRIDSGDLAYLSCIVKEQFDRVKTKYNRKYFVLEMNVKSKVAVKYGLDWFKELVITASNDINEETILSLNEQGHKITAFGIGRFAH